MLAEALAKSLQRQQISSLPGPRPRRKNANANPPVECFTDVQRRDNKVCDSLFPATLLIRPQANVRELFKAAFHLTRDEDYMLYDGASREVVKSYIDGSGPGPDPLALQWDITTTHKSDWNQRVIDILLSLYISMEEKNHWTPRTRQSITNDITSKFLQCRKCWRKAQPLLRDDGTRENMQEVGDRLVDQTNERLRLARVLGRRTTVSLFCCSSNCQLSCSQEV
jgi:hypothetical protein